MWQAVQATSAATIFFDLITIYGDNLVNRAIGANNHVNYLRSEAGDIWSQGVGWVPARLDVSFPSTPGFQLLPR
ncbi:hypothetical protein F4782DRAFT_493703 [Xylaria castorea]|nr:hypothetical protein F4782DRAFT_493703 [Xylaria castorea]